jgi:hypothetical protein
MEICCDRVPWPNLVQSALTRPDRSLYSDTIHLPKLWGIGRLLCQSSISSNRSLCFPPVSLETSVSPRFLAYLTDKDTMLQCCDVDHGETLEALNPPVRIRTIFFSKRASGGGYRNTTACLAPRLFPARRGSPLHLYSLSRIEPPRRRATTRFSGILSSLNMRYNPNGRRMIKQ